MHVRTDVLAAVRGTVRVAVAHAVVVVLIAVNSHVVTDVMEVVGINVLYAVVVPDNAWVPVQQKYDCSRLVLLHLPQLRVMPQLIVLLVVPHFVFLNVTVV